MAGRTNALRVARALTSAERLMAAEHDLEAHAREDDLRFGTLTHAVEEVKTGLASLEGEVRAGFREVSTSITKLETRLGGASGGEPPGPGGGHWHIGPGAWAAISGLAVLAMSVIGWLAVQLYNEEPARVRAASAPVPVQIMKP